MHTNERLLSDYRLMHTNERLLCDCCITHTNEKLLSDYRTMHPMKMLFLNRTERHHTDVPLRVILKIVLHVSLNMINGLLDFRIAIQWITIFGTGSRESLQKKSLCFLRRRTKRYNQKEVESNSSR